MIDACITEDSDNCYWNAATMGNGEGVSFVTIDGVTTHCLPGEQLAEDLTCVPTSFYAPEVAPEVAPAAPEAPTGPVGPVETFSTVPAAGIPSELAVTGAEDISPMALVLGAALLIAGIACTVRARRS